ncbi:MAG: thioredoxin [Kofleriaceae bacterium]|nr:thioredoxin [Myxococcales bacterium]MCB9563362.1 thioredoxin [Kofleriaceae bacterium]MCB9573652.1 thioredoxin [Kofleriaceae bacterium]
MKPVNVTAATFEQEVVRSSIPVVIDFWAPWCGPCRAIAPVLEEMSKAYAGRVKVVKVNVDEEPALGAAFRVRGIPTLAVVDHGKILSTTPGFRGKPALVAMFEELTETPPGAARQVR